MCRKRCNAEEEEGREAKISLKENYSPSLVDEFMNVSSDIFSDLPHGATLLSFLFYCVTDFHPLRKTQNYNMCTQAWQEQRVFIDYALEALGTHPLANTV